MEECKSAIVLGSGLGNLADRVHVQKIVAFEDIDGLPVPAVTGHKGEMVVADLDGKSVLLLKGRVHYYEGYSMKEVTKYIAFLKNVGIENLILTNSAGGINEDFAKGDFMEITDHISSFVPSPLIGVNLEEQGHQRFADMSEVYDKSLREKLEVAATGCGIELKHGVYVQTTGPNYETPAEIRAYRSLGADAVGMSTAVEATFANALGMRVLGISYISNLAAGMSENPLSHEEVTSSANEGADRFAKLILALIPQL